MRAPAKEVKRRGRASKEFELRVDSLNVLNTPQFATPTAINVNINSTSFGRITTATGNRRFVINARLNF